MNYKLVGNSTLQIVLFSMVCIALVVLLFEGSREQIQDNKRAYLERQLIELVPTYDNDILTEAYHKELILDDKVQRVMIYPAKVESTLIAYLVKHVTSKGYSGDITLLTALTPKREIIGVRVLEHKETPGLGDKIESKKSSWILQFNTTSLQTVPSSAWTISSRGGQFDSLTGATITPLAVIDAVYQLLSAVEKEL